MNRVKPSRKKYHLASCLAFGALALGIGLICLAMTNILAQSVHFEDFSISKNYAEKQGKLLEDAVAKTGKHKIHYSEYPDAGENFGSLLIPVLKQKMPIIQGTGTEELKKGVGHYLQSVLPGEEDNCVLAGHRDTFFSGLGKLKKGDQLVVQTVAGTFTYEIRNIRIVDKDDRTVIVPTDHAVLTLSTCYPFQFIGNAPKRYIVSSDLIMSSTEPGN